MKPAAILFDLDGTLIETIGYYYDSFINSLRRCYSIETTQDQHRVWYERGMHLRDIMKELSIPLEGEADLRADRDQEYIAIVHEQAHWLDGAEDAFRAMAHTYPVAIITGSWKRYVDAYDERLGLSRDAAFIITADEIHHHMKPDPYGLLLVTEKLRVDPKECIYVGDQLFDMEAAKAAGMRAIGIGTAHSPATLRENADVYIENLSELIDFLA